MRVESDGDIDAELPMTRRLAPSAEGQPIVSSVIAQFGVVVNHFSTDGPREALQT